MTPEQYRLLQARLRIGRANGTGGSSWTPIEKNGGGISEVPTFTAGAAVHLYVLEAAMLRSTQALPQVGIYRADWWGVANSTVVLEPDTVLRSAQDLTMGFLVDGLPDMSQGAPVYPLKKCAVPEVSGDTGLVGQPMGLRLILTYAS